MFVKESLNINGQEYSLETGKWAKQAGGTVILRWGKIVLMANATAAHEAREGQDFFPLTIDYREKFYAAGQIPGGFIKREGRPSDKETLVARVTDRPIRPLFSKEYKNELQIFMTLLSTDGKQPADAHSITAASAALMISDIPFQGPAAGVRVARINGEFSLFGSNEELAEADINLSLAGTKDAVTMIEGHAKEASEEDMLAAVKFGHEEIKKLCDLQIKMAEQIAPEKQVVEEKEVNEALKKQVNDWFFDQLKEASNTKNKAERSDKIHEVREALAEKLAAENSDLEEDDFNKLKNEANGFFYDMEIDIVRDQIFKDGVRADGRKLDEVRAIDIEVGVLPGVHGSAIFTRGETQSLGVTTLGTESDAQGVDDVEGNRNKRFYLHYNFLPFCVGEVRRYGGAGRREIGHGRLAESALAPVVPDSEDFPYVIRCVSEILESNGSSSMASVCSGSLSMMSAGVPIKGAVAGIAMGLITEGDDYAILSDIAGLEDHFGDMDFKLAGTEKGITAFQLDLKIQGISYEIMEKAMAQAKAGRMHILSKMNEVLAKPGELPDNAPRITTLKIDKDRIGELIGPGGKNIKRIIELTGVGINVDDEGVVSISSNEQEAAAAAVKMIEDQFAELEMHRTYPGKVKKITDFGAFVEVLPGKEGLVHISKISKDRVKSVSDVLSEGDEVHVKVIAIDRQGRVSLSMKDAEVE